MQKVILDTEALLKNNRNIDSLLSESKMKFYVFDFQIMIIQHWQFSLSINKIKWQLKQFRQNGEEGLVLLELELLKSKKLLELMKLELEMKQHETILEGILGNDILQRLTLTKEIKYSVKQIDLNCLKQSGIKMLIPDETKLSMAKEALRNYEHVYNTHLSCMELLNMLTYLICGFTGNTPFLEMNKKELNKYEMPNTWSKFDLQLVKI